MITDLFDKGVHYIGKNMTDVVTINIGAMDGVLFDELQGYSSMYNFTGLYVEPVPYLFERLKNNLGEKHLYENSAISDHNGFVDMITIDKNAIDNKLVHECFYGMSAVYPPKNGLGSEFDKPTVEKYGRMITVPCINLKTLFDKHNITKFEIFKVDAEGYDFKILDQLDLEKYQPKVIRCEWINLTDSEKEILINRFNKHGYVYEVLHSDVTAISKDLYESLEESLGLKKPNKNKITIVTGLWDIGRGNLNDGWSRTYDQYIERFEKLLSIKENMIIYGDQELESIVFKHRTHENTQFIRRDINWFKYNEFYTLIQDIRTNPQWSEQAGWLKESTQAKLDMYNPLVMSKMFLLNDARIMDKFDSDYLFWIDAGITNTVHIGYFTHDNVLDKISDVCKKFMFLAFPYDAVNEIHGFNYSKLCEYANNENVNKVGRGGFFGGPKETISESNNIYYQLLLDSLKNGYMGTEESLFTIMFYKYPNLFEYSELEYNGFISTFFENLKNNNCIVKSEKVKYSLNSKLDHSNVGLYVIGFNSPNQFRTLIKSMLSYDKDYIQKPKKYLIDNSTDLSTTDEYSKICNEFNFEHIKHENLGICGGRQWIAEHFEKSNLEYMLFFEDDMFFYPNEGEICRNGFNRFVEGLYNKSLRIVKEENLDFLKLNFSEFYGDNSTQWSWYNVPQIIRDEVWPNNKKLPVQGLDPNAPRTKFEVIKSLEGVPYALGEIYYCNWPQIVSKEGNKKMFLTTKWARPFEQTWMSYIYQETIKGNIKSGLLLLTPTEHDRFDHYDGSLRKES
jgi:FkbM family methyltransferase